MSCLFTSHFHIPVVSSLFIPGPFSFSVCSHIFVDEGRGV